MHAQVERTEYAKILAGNEGFKRGANAMHQRLTTLLPEQRSGYRHEEEGRIIVQCHVIEQFPKVGDNGPYFKVPMPLPTYFAGRGSSPSQQRWKPIAFRAVENLIRKREFDTVSELRWWTWEPELGTKELEEHTRTMVVGLQKLSVAFQMFQQSFYPPPDMAMSILHEAIEELRLKLGRIGPNDIEEAQGSPR